MKWVEFKSIGNPDGRNFNDSQRQMLERYLNFLQDATEETPEDSRPPAIINSIKDWLDSGDDDAITGLSGAESPYYQDLSSPYSSRNGPMMDINDLLRVKGVTPEMFYGNSEKPGLAEVLTVHGMKPGSGTGFTYPGKININTAELPVLVALMPSENTELAAALYELRQQATTDKNAPDFTNPTWYQNIAGLGDVNLDTKMLTTASDIFRIESEAKVNDSVITVTAVVERQKNEKNGKWDCKILSWSTQ
jgi:general secretion pathway protein K